MVKPSDIWSHFNQLGKVVGFKQERSKCKYCDYELTKSAQRCENHLKICEKATDKILQSYFGPNFKKIQKNKLKTSNQTVNSCVEQKELELLFAQSIFYSGLYLSLPDLSPIRKLWKQARPDFKVPGRKKLSTTLLNHVFEDTKKEVEHFINKAEYFCLISDGW
jgi:hypothetical protein